MEINRIEGILDSKGLRFGIVVSRFNQFFTEKLLDGAVDCLVRHGAAKEDITAAFVPGVFEIPPVAARMARSGKYDAIICLGAVIRGSTPHFDFIAGEGSRGIARVAMESGVTIAYGVITTDNIEQAVERSGTKAGNKGWDAAQSAIEMVNLSKVLG